MTCVLVFIQHGVIHNTMNKKAKIAVLANLNQALLAAIHHLVIIRDRYWFYLQLYPWGNQASESEPWESGKAVRWQGWGLNLAVLNPRAQIPNPYILTSFLINIVLSR